MAEGFKGKLNIYTCAVCRGHVVTNDVDEGVTPFMMECRATVGCRGDMKSSMYRVYDQDMRPDYEWYRPTAVEVVEPPLRDHVRRGGLLLRPARRAGEAASTDRLQTVIVNGQPYEVPRSANDHCLGFAERAVEMAGYEMSMSRQWEVKDEAGEVLGYKDNPDRVRYVSLPAGTAS